MLRARWLNDVLRTNASQASSSGYRPTRNEARRVSTLTLCYHRPETDPPTGVKLIHPAGGNLPCLTPELLPLTGARFRKWRVASPGERSLRSGMPLKRHLSWNRKSYGCVLRSTCNSVEATPQHRRLNTHAAVVSPLYAQKFCVRDACAMNHKVFSEARSHIQLIAASGYQASNNAQCRKRVLLKIDFEDPVTDGVKERREMNDPSSHPGLRNEFGRNSLGVEECCLRQVLKRRRSHNSASESPR